MRKFSVLSIISLATALPALFGQDPATAPVAKASPFTSILGEVTNLDNTTKQVTIKADSGASSTVAYDDKTHFMKLAPGEKDLKKATDVQLSELSVGDRALARVRKMDDGTFSAATTVVVMTKAELVKHHQVNQEEWQKRGMNGTVTVVNPATKEVTFKTLGTEPKQIVIEPADKIDVRRYAPDSVKFSDAKPSAVGEIKAGDTIRVLGNKNEDGSRVTPEVIVYGTFVRQAGTIISIDAAANTVKMTDVTTKKPVTVKVNEATTVKKLPPTVAAMMLRSQQGGAAGAPGGAPGAGGPPNAAGGRPGGAPAAGGPGGPGGPGGGPGGPGGGRRFDPSRVLENAPTITLADLKPGDAIMVSSSSGADPSTVTAISLVAGVEPLLTAPSKGGRGSAVDGSWNFEMSIPQ
jgi:hypothetical protein